MPDQTVLKYGEQPGLRFACVLDGRGGCRELDWPGVEAWKALHGLDVPMNKSLLLHPNTPKDAVETWVKAVREMLQDREFLTKAEPEFGPYPQIVGDSVRPIMQASFAIPPEARAWLAKYVKSRYDVDLAQ